MTPIIAQIGMHLLNWFLKRKLIREEDKRIFNEMAEILRRYGVKRAKSVFETEDQIRQIEEAWKKEETKN